MTILTRIPIISAFREPAAAAPVIDNLSGDTLAYEEGDGAVVIDQGTAAGVSDADSVDFDGRTLTRGHWRR